MLYQLAHAVVKALEVVNKAVKVGLLIAEKFLQFQLPPAYAIVPFYPKLEWFDKTLIN
jgi:hypothetical protein